MIQASSVYQDVNDALLSEGNGECNYALFNRLSRLAELDCLDWITGDIEGKTPPEPYATQKVKDWASPFIVQYKAHATDGFIQRPKDYYGFENMALIGSMKSQVPCDQEPVDPTANGDTPIALLDGDPFDQRCQTYIDELKPSFVVPIAKAVGNRFEFMPKDIGSVKLEYYRYPVFAEIKTKEDTTFKIDVPDEATTTNYEWDEKMRPILVWFIVDRFSNRTNNQAMKSFNSATQKTPHQQP